MATLTSAGSLSASCPGRFDSLRSPFGLPAAVYLRWRFDSCVHCALLSFPTATTHTTTPSEASRCCPPQVSPLAEVETSPVPNRLVVVVMLYRVHFRCGRSGSFRCFPPRLAATRFLPVLSSPTVANGRCLPPRRSAQLRSALARPAGTVSGAVPAGRPTAEPSQRDELQWKTPPACCSHRPEPDAGSCRR